MSRYGYTSKKTAVTLNLGPIKITTSGRMIEGKTEDYTFPLSHQVTL